MKFLHTGDLHIGKTVNGFSMLEDQDYLLNQISEIAVQNKVDGVFLAGDIYDRAIPSAEAVVLLDRFLTSLTECGMKVYLVSGNHDSPERLSFGESLLAKQGIGIGAYYQDRPAVFTKRESWGDVQLLLLPFLKPARMEVRTTQEAVEKALSLYWERERTGEGRREGAVKRHVLITHYFVTNGGKEPELSDSETTLHVGGLDNVDVSFLQGFDYVALGHIHKPQQIGKGPVYYAGSPLKYSFGEVDQEKSVFIGEIGEAGLLSLERKPLFPLREMRRIKGSLQELLRAGSRDGAREDYIQAVLTDREELMDPMVTLRSVYPNIMQIIREEKQGEHAFPAPGVLSLRKREPEALFAEFYELVRERELTEEGKKALSEILRKETGKL